MKLLEMWAGVGNASSEYWTELRACATELGLDWRVLDTYIFIENARRLEDSNGNQYRGMLQWGNAAAQSMGFSSSASMLAQYPGYAGQFQIVRKWIRLLWKQHGRRGELGYFYLCHFLPVNAPHYADKSYVLRGENGRLVQRGYSYYDENAGLDYNKDGYITVGDLDNIVISKARSLGYDLGTINTNTNGMPGTSSNNDYLGILKQAAPIIAILAIASIFTSND